MRDKENKNDYIAVPQNLNQELLRQEFGAAAVAFYLSRIEERRQLGHTYLNPLKTVYIWACRDRQTFQGFYSTFAGRTRHKSKNYGGS